MEDGYIEVSSATITGISSKFEVTLMHRVLPIHLQLPVRLSRLRLNNYFTLFSRSSGIGRILATYIIQPAGEIDEQATEDE